MQTNFNIHTLSVTRPCRSTRATFLSIHHYSKGMNCLRRVQITETARFLIGFKCVGRPKLQLHIWYLISKKGVQIKGAYIDCTRSCYPHSYPSVLRLRETFNWSIPTFTDGKEEIPEVGGCRSRRAFMSNIASLKESFQLVDSSNHLNQRFNETDSTLR